MIILKAIIATTALSIVGLLLGLVLLVPTIAASNAVGIEAAAGVLSIDPSEQAARDIPPILVPIYVEAARQCPGLPWTVIAGIGKVESNHGRYGGATIGPDGTTTPPIIGIPLNGTNGTATIRDTDNGRLDNDIIWDRAVGPFQFIPTSWAIFGVDGNEDGTANPHNVYDAVPAAVRHLCPNGQITDIEAAIFSYNHSDQYVRDVLEWSSTYTGVVSAIPIAGYAAPVNGLTPTQAIRSHHDYPAWDVGATPGTPTYAMVDGTVTIAYKSDAIFDGVNGRCGSSIVIEGVDTVGYTYCHLSAINVQTGQQVVAGQQLGLTGGQPGSPGAGNTTGPQPVIHSIMAGTPINPLASPTLGCIHGQVATNWESWLSTPLHDRLDTLQAEVSSRTSPTTTAVS